MILCCEGKHLNAGSSCDPVRHLWSAQRMSYRIVGIDSSIAKNLHRPVFLSGGMLNESAERH